ncbi:MAG: LuxR C-terminal-related transcriptional regulator [Aestuariivirga sp.]|nr:LuxR C-terminal-related transcriptional regulator [Aestuariivirga sp.]
MSTPIIRIVGDVFDHVDERAHKPVIKFEAGGRQYEAIPRGQWRAMRYVPALMGSCRRAGSIIIDKVSHVLLERLESGAPLDSKNLATVLTARELQIAFLIADGKCDKVVARELGISDNTVREHLRRVFHKLQITKRTSLVARLLRSPGDI